MIRSLRRRHLATWIVLALLLPLLFVLGLRARHPRPVNPDAAVRGAVEGARP